MVRRSYKEKKRLTQAEKREKKTNEILHSWKTQRPYQQKPEGSAELLGKTK
jgi:hypothetical protein